MVIFAKWVVEIGSDFRAACAKLFEVYQHFARTLCQNMSESLKGGDV